MKLQLHSTGHLPRMRRTMRKAGLRLTARHGNLYTLLPSAIRQPGSEKQLGARDLLAKASALASEEMKNETRKLYWTCHAAEMGYKTARGACIAHHMRLLKQNENMLVKRETALKTGKRKEKSGTLPPLSDADIMTMINAWLIAAQYGQRARIKTARDRTSHPMSGYGKTLTKHYVPPPPAKAVLNREKKYREVRNRQKAAPWTEYPKSG